MKVIDTSQLDDNLSAYSDTEVYWIYNGLDCALTLEVFHVIRQQLDAQTEATYRFAMELVAPVLEMMLEGMPVSLLDRARVASHYEQELAELESWWEELCVDGLGLTPANNPRKGKRPLAVLYSSPKQTLELFRDVLRIEIKKKRKKGQDEARESVDRDTLEKLRMNIYAEPLVNALLACRDRAKMIGFLSTKLDPDHRIRCSFNVAGTDTGRLSSSFSDMGTGTNLQNVSGRAKEIFHAPPGYVFVEVDLGQGDSRGVGATCWQLFYGSHGPAFAGSYLDACESGDLHTTVCKMAWQDLPWGDDPKGWKSVAEQKAYRDLSYRDLSKRLGHGCLTADHEVLTPEGWVPITDFPPVIMEWAEGHSQFVPVTAWTAKPYTGTLHEFTGNSLSVCMTADHRVPYKADQRSAGIKVRPASSGPQAFMPLGSGWVGGNEVVPARLIAAFMADGYQSHNQMRFHFHKQRKKNRLIALCEQYGYSYKVSGDKISVEGKLPKRAGAFMFNWTAKCLADFIDELKHWNGHAGKTFTRISSTHRDQLEWFQTFGRILGVGGQIQKPVTSGFGSTVYQLGQNNRQWASGASATHTQQNVTNVSVFCPTVSSGFFYVRRNGRVFVTGNSNYMGQAPTMATHTKLPVPVIADFQRAYFSAFECIPLWHRHVIEQIQTHRMLVTLWGRRRIFWSDPKRQTTLNAAIAYDPQSTTGEFTNRGLVNLWRVRNEQSLPIRFLIQVHDSLLMLVPYRQVNALAPLILKHLHVTFPLVGDRPFSIPHELKVGWNYGKFHPDKNPFGLKEWKGEESRVPPKRQDSFSDFLNLPAQTFGA